MPISISRKKRENQKIVNDVIKNLSKIDHGFRALYIKDNIKHKPYVPSYEGTSQLMYDRFKKINKLYSKGLYQSYPEAYSDAIATAIATHGTSYKLAHQLMQAKTFPPAKKLEAIDNTLKALSASLTHELKESLLVFQSQIQHQHLKQQFDGVINILDNPDTSNLEGWTNNIKTSLYYLSLNNTTSNLEERKEFVGTTLSPKTKQYAAINNQNAAIYSQKLNELINTLDKVEVFKLAKLISNAKQQINNLDEYFIKINKDIAAVKRSSDSNTIKSLGRINQTYREIP